MVSFSNFYFLFTFLESGSEAELRKDIGNPETLHSHAEFWCQRTRQ